MREFASLFAAKRKEKNLSQTDIAKMLNVTRQSVSNWERNLSFPDMSLMPEIAKILGVTVDELLTGKEPEKEIIEKEIIVEKEIIKKPSVKRICAIVAPILIICVIASALMGVYIPKAIARNKAEAFEEEKEPPKPEKVVYTPIEIDGYYGDISVNTKSRLIDGIAYYVFYPRQNSDYTFEITAPKNAVVTFNEQQILKFNYNTTKQYSKYFAVPEEDENYNGTTYEDMRNYYGHKIAIDMRNCTDEEKRSNQHSISLKQKGDFENITIPANSRYSVAVKVDRFVAKSYSIKNENVKFEQIIRQMKFYSDDTSYWGNYDTDDINWVYNDILTSRVDLLMKNNCFASHDMSVKMYANEYYFLQLVNLTNEDVQLTVVENEIGNINMGEWVNFDMEDDCPYRIYKFDDYNYLFNPYVKFTRDNTATSNSFAFYNYTTHVRESINHWQSNDEFYIFRIALSYGGQYIRVGATENKSFKFVVCSSEFQLETI